MHQHEQHKNIPNKNKQLLIPKRYKLPITLNTTAKDKAQNAAQQRLINNAARRISNNKNSERREWHKSNEQTQTRRKAYSHKQKARAKRGQSNTISAVKSRGTRDERAGASPHGGPLTRLVIYSIYRLLYIKLLSRMSCEARSPTGSDPRDTKQNTAKSILTTRHYYNTSEQKICGK